MTTEQKQIHAMENAGAEAMGALLGVASAIADEIREADWTTARGMRLCSIAVKCEQDAKRLGAVFGIDVPLALNTKNALKNQPSPKGDKRIVL